MKLTAKWITSMLYGEGDVRRGLETEPNPASTSHGTECSKGNVRMDGKKLWWPIVASTESPAGGRDIEARVLATSSRAALIAFLGPLALKDDETLHNVHIGRGAAN
jgi:hypothetical protein